MKKIATVLLVLAAIIGMAGPVLGVEAGASAGAYADWDIAAQTSSAWSNNGWESATAGSLGIAGGYTESSSGASATWYSAGASSEGYCEGSACFTVSGAEAEELDEAGATEAVSDSYADGDYVEVDSGAESFWGPPISSGAWADAYVIGGWAESSAGAGATI